MREQQSRATQEKHERMLNALFKLPGNDRCADCTAKNPRWASYSLGVFLCIRCGSLHRKMGTHISKVKSVSMDRWTLQEIQHMTNLGGNQVINRQVVTNPQKNPLPITLDDDHAMERYVRDKWERRLFQEEEISHLTELKQIGNSSTSLATVTTTSSTLNTPSLSYEEQHHFAGQVINSSSSTSSLTNPFKRINQHNNTSYHSFTSSSSSVAPISNNNPFIINQPLQQSPFDIHYNITDNYFTPKNNSNPFLSQQQ